MDSSLLILVLFLFMKNNKAEESRGLIALNDYIRTIKIDPKYTFEKIRILKKVGPYFPEEYIPTINKSILFTERIIKINELANFMRNNEYQYIKEPVYIENNKERISKIINIVQKEVPRRETNNLGIMVDLIVNMEKYKKILSLLGSAMTSQDGLKDPAQLLSIAGPIMGIDTSKDNEKLKDINKMMEIMKVLNSPKNETQMENQLLENKEKPLESK